MAKLTLEQIQAELKTKEVELVSDIITYQNLNSEIVVRCDKSHTFSTTMNNVRNKSFHCPVCAGNSSKGFSVKSAAVVPPKAIDSYRIVALDNATNNMGVAVFDDGKLVYYKLYSFEGTQVQRLSKIRDFIENIALRQWRANFLQFEDIQFQHNYSTYEALIKLVGICEVAAEREGVPCEKTRSNIWRSSFGINGGGRANEKRKAIELVKTMYNIDVGDDVAEAILIGKYRVNLLSKVTLKKLF